MQKAAVERLVKAGAFDASASGPSHFAAVAKAYQAADERAADRRRGQKSFLDMFETGDDDEGPANGPGPTTACPTCPSGPRPRS